MFAKIRRSRKEGFTLIELMIVVAIIGVLIALALPAFVNYFRRTKTAEVGPNIRNMFSGSAAYYLDAHWASRSPTRGVSAASEHCYVTSVNTPTAPTADKHTVDFSDTAMAPFAAVGFSVSDPMYYQYFLISPGASACGLGPLNNTIYTFQAQGDLDGDGVFSTFELAVGSSEANELYRTPGMYIENELE